jgi:cysteinyl-tRNA synthetase
LAEAGSSRAERLAGVERWAYQLQGLEEEGAIEALVASPYELLVLDPTRTVQGSEAFDAAGMVAALHDAGKLVLAYLDIGQAEDYRTYWQADWVAPSDDERGEPDFLVRPDPDGWSGNYPVAFWEPAWQELVLRDPAGLVQQALDDGFDGAYLDWIEAYEDPVVIEVAEGEGIDPAEAMVGFVRALGATARERDPDFLVVPQNAAWLVYEQPDYLTAIDGLAIEDLSFGGEADTAWDDPASGDIPQDAEEQAELEELIALYRDAGLPVFCVDYALDPDNAAEAEARALEAGCVPFISQTPLDRLPGEP